MKGLKWLGGIIGGIAIWSLVMIALGGFCGIASGLFGIGFHSGKTLVTNIVK
jgi:hypothetical protein